MNPIHQCFQKISPGNHFSYVRDVCTYVRTYVRMYVCMCVRTYGRTDKGDTICPPIINGGGIKTRLWNHKVNCSSEQYRPIKSVWHSSICVLFALVMYVIIHYRCKCWGAWWLYTDDVVFVFTVPPIAEVIWGWGHKSLIRQTGEARDWSRDPWFTWQEAYPLHHGGFSTDPPM